MYRGTAAAIIEPVGSESGTLAGSRLYTSDACAEEINDNALSRFDKVFANLEVKI